MATSTIQALTVTPPSSDGVAKEQVVVNKDRELNFYCGKDDKYSCRKRRCLTFLVHVIVAFVLAGYFLYINYRGKGEWKIAECTFLSSELYPQGCCESTCNAKRCKTVCNACMDYHFDAHFIGNNTLVKDAVETIVGESKFKTYTPNQVVGCMMHPELENGKNVSTTLFDPASQASLERLGISFFVFSILILFPTIVLAIRTFPNYSRKR